MASFLLRLSDGEHRALLDAARVVGVSVQVYVKGKVFGDAVVRPHRCGGGGAAVISRLKSELASSNRVDPTKPI